MKQKTEKEQEKGFCDFHVYLLSSGEGFEGHPFRFGCPQDILFAWSKNIISRIADLLDRALFRTFAYGIPEPVAFA